MKARSGPTAAIFVALMAAGCAQDGTLTTGGFNTSSIESGATAQASKSDPACLTLTAQIEALNRDGTADKVSKAAAKKYKLKTEDLAKADELNKANTEFQTKCSAYPPRPVVAATTTPAMTTSTTTTTTAAPPKKVAAKKTTPPVPTAKPPAAATATATPATTTSAPPQTAENPDPTLPQP